MNLFNIVLLVMIVITVWAGTDMFRFFCRKRRDHLMEASLNRSLRHAVESIGPAPEREEAVEDQLIAA